MDKIENYIQEHRAQGYSDTQIKSALNRGGWGDEHFSHLFESLAHPLDVEAADPVRAVARTWSLTNVGILASAKILLLVVAFFGITSLTNDGGETLGVSRTPDVDFSQAAKDARDAEREKDLNGLRALIETSASTSGLPSDVAQLEDFVSASASSELREPILDRIYVFTFRDPALGQFQYIAGQTCDGNTSDNPSVFFVSTRLESQKTICIDNAS